MMSCAFASLLFNCLVDQISAIYKEQKSFDLFCVDTLFNSVMLAIPIVLFNVHEYM